MNSMMLDRRSLLIFFGLRELVAQEAPSKTPDWFAKALARMAETHRPGVIIVVPEQEREALGWGNALHDLMEDPADPVKELLCEAVFICMTPAVADATVRRAGERHNRILLAPDGSRLEADAVDLAQLSPEAFVGAFAAFVRDRRLACPLPTDAQRDALRRLGSESLEARDAATADLGRDAERILPFLAREGRTAKDPEVAARCRALVLSHFDDACEKAPGPRLPYGCRMPKFVSAGCGGVLELKPEEAEPRVFFACGKGSVPVRPRLFFRFLAS